MPPSAEYSYYSESSLSPVQGATAEEPPAEAVVTGDGDSCDSPSSTSETGTGSVPPTRPCEAESEMTAWSRRQVRKTTATKTKVKPPASDEETRPEGPETLNPKP